MMKKIFYIFLIVILVFTINANAQGTAKFGHVNYAELMQLVPGFDTAQANILSYQTELQEEGEAMAKEFRDKQTHLQAYAGTAGASSAKLKIMQDELENLYKKIQEFSQSIELLVYEKQLEVLKPLQDLLLEAIKEVAKEGKYTYIFDLNTLASSALGDDISTQVKTKLGVTK